MFFRHVVGRVQLYPYLHIVTWGLPKRYLSLLRIFNLPLEDYPHQFITQTSETFNNYEHQVTKKSISALQPNTSRNDFTELGTAEGDKTRNFQLDQASTSGNSTPPRKGGRRSKKKPIISIKVKLDDDLRNLKRTNGKNFDKILSRCSRKSCMLVIQRASNSKHDEYSLNFVNNTSYGKPYNKLLKKNRRKKEIWYDAPTSKPFGESKKSKACEFSEEAIFPYPKIDHNISSNTNITRNRPPSNNTPKHNFQSEARTYDSSKGINNNKVEVKPHEPHEENNINAVKEKENKIKAAQLAVPSYLIPYEEPIAEEKPLRHWPVLTKLFDEVHKGIHNYLKSLNSLNETDEEEDPQEVIHKEDGIVSIDINEAKAYHESSRSTSNIKDYSATNSEATKTNENANTITENGSSESLESPPAESTSTINESEKINEDSTLDTKYLIEKSVIPTKFSLVNETSSIVGNTSNELYTSTAYLVIAQANDESKDDGKMIMCNGDMKNVANSSESDFLANTRLLSTSIKSYESITKTDDVETCYHFKENSETTLNEINKIDSERKDRGMKKLYFFNVVLALFVTVVLGIILFISFADNTTINGVLERYIKR